MRRTSPSRPISLAIAAAFAVALSAMLMIALFPVFPRQLDIRAGDQAERTIKAPRRESFESAFLTEQRRDEATNSVQEILEFDQGRRTIQVGEYDRVAGEVAQIRALEDASRKREQLGALGLSQRSVETVINLPEDRWQAVAAEGRRVLGLQLSVSLGEADINAAKDAVDGLIGAEFSADQALLAAELVRPLITTTLVVNPERTEQARASARAAVPAQRVNVEAGDVIVSAGSPVDEVAIEKLRATGVLSQSVEWRNVAAVGILSVVAALAVAAYIYVLQPRGVSSERHLIALALVVMLPLLVAKFYLPLVLPDDNRDFFAYALPLAAAPILIAALLDTQVAAVTAGVLGLLTALIATLMPDVSLVASVGGIDTLRLMLVYTLGPLLGVFIVHGADRLNRYMTAGVAVGATSFAVLMATWFLDGEREAVDIAWMALATGFGGVSAGILAAGVFVTAGMLFGVTTRVQLMELSQLNAPLLRRLQDEAPGTFHHSVIVGNLAERAADLVGADALLTRVGCYYHDIGKVLQPGVYIENQMGGGSPHDDMAPEESARLIQQHVSEGLQLARRERLPVRVQAFIPEHHGTRLVAYFFRKAAETDPAVDPAGFTYPGPRPQSRETAIVMLADSTEAVVRSSPDRAPERIDQLVEDVLAERVAEGQLDDSDLTLRDLRTIAESFKATMRAVYHPRVQYPQPTALETRRRTLRLPLLTYGDRPEPRRRSRRAP